ncbi:MAG: hypothetical protein QM775_01360 [Pirellulales bacterium]
MATVSRDAYLKVWNVADGVEVRSRKPGLQLASMLMSCAWSADGTKIAVGAYRRLAGNFDGGGVCVTSLDRGDFDFYESPDVNLGFCQALTWSPDGKLLAGAHWYQGDGRDWQGAVLVWNVATRQLVVRLEEPYVRDVAFVDAGRALLTVSPDGGLKRWNVPASQYSAGTSTLADPAFQVWLKATQSLPAEKQLEAVSQKLVELNPGFDGKLTGADTSKPPGIDSQGLGSLGITSNDVNDLSPLRAVTSLRYLSCNGKNFGMGKFADLSPLEGISLSDFSSYDSAIADLSTLAKCKSLKSAKLLGTNVTAEQVAALRAALPGCKVDWDGLTNVPAAERRIAEWVLQNGGDLQVLVSNRPVNVRDVRELPSEPFWNNSLSIKRATNDDLARLAKCVGLTNIHLNFAAIDDAGLAHLKGLGKLLSLSLAGTGVTDGGLAQLAGLPRLTYVNVKGTRVTAAGVAALQKALPNCKVDWDDPTKPVDDRNAALDPAFQQWLAATQQLPADKQLTAVAQKLMELNPGFDGKLVDAGGGGKPRIENGVVTEVGFSTQFVTNIAPVRAFPGLRKLWGCGLQPGTGPLGKLVDLSPLAGLQFVELTVYYNRIEDLSPLRGMPLVSIGLAANRCTDFEPLRGMPLQKIAMNGCRTVRDFSPLRGMRLTNLSANGTSITDLSVLAAMPLEGLTIAGTKVTDLTPLSAMPLTFLDLGDNTPVSSLAPLHQCKRMRTLLIANHKIDPAQIEALQGRCRIARSITVRRSTLRRQRRR